MLWMATPNGLGFWPEVGCALLLHIAYVEGMAESKIDPFVSTEPEVELDPETNCILEERIKSADAGRLVSAEEARQRIQECLSKFSTMKTR